MEHAQWRNYRGHSIVERRTGLLGRKRYEVWKAGHLIATLRDPVKAELYIDALTPL